MSRSAVPPKVDLGDERKILQRQAEALRFKNTMNVVARTGLPLQSPIQSGNVTSMGALVAAAKLAKRCNTICFKLRRFAP